MRRWRDLRSLTNATAFTFAPKSPEGDFLLLLLEFRRGERSRIISNIQKNANKKSYTSITLTVGENSNSNNRKF
jgi:hypothetical protein